MRSADVDIVVDMVMQPLSCMYHIGGASHMQPPDCIYSNQRRHLSLQVRSHGIVRRQPDGHRESVRRLDCLPGASEQVSARCPVRLVAEHSLVVAETRD